MAARFRVTQFVLDSGTGTQTITLAGMGTCKGYVLFVTGATANGTERDQADYAIGMCDESGNTRSVQCSSEHNQGTTDTNKGSNADLIHFIDASAGGAADFELQHDSFVTDGFVIDIVNARSQAWLITAWVFYGSDISTEVIAVSGTTSDDTEVTATISLDPNIIIGATAIGGSDSDSQNHQRMHFSVATDNGSPFEQAGVAIADATGQSTSQTTTNACDTRMFLGFHGSDVGRQAANAYEVTTLTAPTFGITQRTGQGAQALRMSFMLINVNGAVDYKVGTFSYPTGTGVVNHTSPGFKPQFVAMGVASKTDFMDEDINITESGSVFYIGAADGTEETCSGINTEAAQVTSDNGSYTNTNLIDTRDGNGAAEMVGAFDGFTANGWDVDYSDAASSAWSGIYLAIEQDVTPASFLRRYEHMPAPNPLLRM